MHNQKAFTLIELLVVVLIIGILSAVALPQYQKAVTKARFTEAITTLRAMKTAKDACIISGGNDCSDLDSWDISFNGQQDSQEIETDNFWFETDDYWNGAPGPVAGYKKEKVCLCYYNQDVPFDEQTYQTSLNSTLVISQGEGGCSDKEPSFDYAKLLNLPEDENCGCC